MKYMLLIYGDEALDTNLSAAEIETQMGEYFAFTQAAQEKGIMHGGEGLQPTATATTIQVKNGKTVSTDGPFAETKEQLGGFYLLNCQNLDEAIEWASKIPHAKSGSIEIRPVMVFE